MPTLLKINKVLIFVVLLIVFTVLSIFSPIKEGWLYATSGEPRALNNLVTELLNITNPSDKDYIFTNLRDGWVFFSFTAEVMGSNAVRISIDSKSEVIILHTQEKDKTQEAMRFLSQGEHIVNIRCEGKPRLKRLIVRAIPELIYSEFQYDPYVTRYGPYDWKFLERYVLNNVNTIIEWERKDHNYYRQYINEWKKQGKKWIVHTGLPRSERGGVITADEAYRYWAGNIGLQDVGLDGIIADEFAPGNEKEYPPWTEAVKRISENEQFKGKVFYPYLGWGAYSYKLSELFIRTVISSGYKLVMECYLKEQPTEKEAEGFMDSELKQKISGYRKTLPGSEKDIIVCLGYLSAPPESLSTNPNVDFKVFMDMQFNLIANDPVFFGLYGIEEYTSGYADEEVVRWASRLYRHYCIEGKTEMLSKQYGYSYLLTHIQNPDFKEGTKGWELSPAESESILDKKMAGYGWLQGRYPQSSEGDNCLWTKRSKKGPNLIWQEIKNLEPGRLYSLKMITGDYLALSEGKSVAEKHAVSIKIENVKIISEKSFQHIFTNHCHFWGAFNNKNRAGMNYHVKIFRAKGRNARLTISDWGSDKEPVGPTGQELMYNFIEIQPYFEK